MVRRFTVEWLGRGDARDPVHSPGLVDDDVLRALPATHLVTCEFDPLTPECQRFLARLQATGADVGHDHFDDLPHEFISMTGVSAAASAAGARTIDRLADLAGG